jgi:signal transduction histidine kinase
VPLHRTEVDLAELLEKAVAHQRAIHLERPYTLKVCEGAMPRRIYADSVLVRRAIENVLDNAHKYSPPGSPVNVSVTASPTALLVEIRDWGFGIRPDDLSRVFSPFFRADRSRTRATGGVGLGLALAKRIMDAHGGGIDLASQVDAGTTVTFRLPLVDGARVTPLRIVS